MESIRKLLSKNKRGRIILVGLGGALAVVVLVLAGLSYLTRVNDRLSPVAVSDSGGGSIKVPIARSAIEQSLQKYPLSLGMIRDSAFAQGGVVPHHLLASDLIAEFFYSAYARVSPRRVIVIGPNHPDAGIYKITTSPSDWETVYGKVTTDKAVVAAADTLSFVGVDSELLAREHSIFTVIPFIQAYFPEATVVPFAISSDISQSELNDFIRTLKPFIDEETFVVASVDFSHYLSSDNATARDGVMRRLIEERAYDTIRGLQSDFLDSPASLIATLRLTEQAGAKDIEIIKNITSADIIGRPLDSSTSYFTILFTTSTLSAR